jgi:hypothetical protein
MIITTHGERVQPLQSVKLVAAVLMVMSGMDPHMISETWDGFWLSFGWVVSKWALLGCGSVLVRLRCAIEIVILRR